MPKRFSFNQRWRIKEIQGYNIAINWECDK